MPNLLQRKGYEKMANYDALTVANYVVYHALNHKKGILHLKLQKILYFIEAHYLVDHGKPLIAEHFEKWKLGPVIPEVYHEYKTFVSRPITRVPPIRSVTFNEEADEFEFSVEKFDPESVDIGAADKEFIERITDLYIEEDAFDLVKRTHKHELWSDYEKEIMAGGHRFIYEKEEMRNYFLSRKDLLEDTNGR
jgi:uncharacterized phage-associated protein